MFFLLHNSLLDVIYSQPARRSGATNLYLAGTPLSEIMQLGG